MPLLNSGHLVLHDEPAFDTPRIPWFIHRTEISKLLGGVEVDFFRAAICASFRSSIGLEMFRLHFPCSRLPAQVAIMERICTQCTPLFSCRISQNFRRFFGRRKVVGNHRTMAGDPSSIYHREDSVSSWDGYSASCCIHPKGAA